MGQPYPTPLYVHADGDEGEGRICSVYGGSGEAFDFAWLNPPPGGWVRKGFCEQRAG